VKRGKKIESGRQTKYKKKRQKEKEERITGERRG
jgi:hypothetical protein